MGGCSKLGLLIGALGMSVLSACGGTGADDAAATASTGSAEQTCEAAVGDEARGYDAKATLVAFDTTAIQMAAWDEKVAAGPPDLPLPEGEGVLRSRWRELDPETPMQICFFRGHFGHPAPTKDGHQNPAWDLGVWYLEDGEPTGAFSLGWEWILPVEDPNTLEVPEDPRLE